MIRSPMLPPLNDAWLGQVLALHSGRHFSELLNQLLEAEPDVSRAITALELIAASGRWPRFGLDPAIVQWATGVNQGESCDRLSLIGYCRSLVNCVADPRIPETISQLYWDDLLERLNHSLPAVDFDLNPIDPELPAQQTPELQRRLELSRLVTGHRILDVKLFVWPFETWQESDVELALVLATPAHPQSVTFGAFGIGSYVRFCPLEFLYRGEAGYDHRRKQYVDQKDLLSAAQGEDWSGLLLDIPRGSDFGYLLGNSITDIQVLNSEPDGFRLRFATGPDIWSVNAADFNWISIDQPPQAAWFEKFEGPWVSESQ